MKADSRVWVAALIPFLLVTAAPSGARGGGQSLPARPIPLSDPFRAAVFRELMEGPRAIHPLLWERERRDRDKKVKEWKKEKAKKEKEKNAKSKRAEKEDLGYSRKELRRAKDDMREEKLARLEAKADRETRRSWTKSYVVTDEDRHRIRSEEISDREAARHLDLR
jgi:hypothetical protein